MVHGPTWHSGAITLFWPWHALFSSHRFEVPWEFAGKTPTFGKKTIPLASYSGKHRKTHNLGSGFFYNFGFGLKMHQVFFSGWFKPHGPCESGVNQGAYLRCYALQGFRISSVWCFRGWHTFGVFFFVVEGLEASFRVRISLSFFHFWGLAWVEESNLGPMV